jgi:hypothetical protein
MAQYIGIIDSEGLDAFQEVDPTAAIMRAFATGEDAKDPMAQLCKPLSMRALANEGRHAIIFFAELSSEDIDLMEYADPIFKAMIVLRNSSKFGIASQSKRQWKTLQKLRPEYLGNIGGERSYPRTVSNPKGIAPQKCTL